MQKLRPDLQIIAEFVDSGSKILDLGCADGDLLAYLIENKQVKGSGIELSEAFVLDCVRRGLSVRQGKIEEGMADYPDGSVDVVILSQTLPFLNDPSFILNEMLRIGRHAIVSIPNWGYWRCRLELMLSGRIPQEPDLEQKWHGSRRWQAFTLADFEDLCQWLNIDIDQRVFLNGNWRIENGQNWRARTAVYSLKLKE